MRDLTKSRLRVFVIGILVATFVSVFITFAFFEADIGHFVRNIIITNLIFIALNLVWIRLHRNYETIYKSGFEEVEEK
ncbi:hypothetical protein HYU18_01255 [Candidatus Woesearchaeota archaeon]|nr:hypothetical protein [Candidatus Woesearchaeota archaeon]